VGKVGDNSVNESAQLVQKQSAATACGREPLLLKAPHRLSTWTSYLEGMDLEGVDVAITDGPP